MLYVQGRLQGYSYGIRSQYRSVPVLQRIPEPARTGRIGIIPWQRIFQRSEEKVIVEEFCNDLTADLVQDLGRKWEGHVKSYDSSRVPIGRETAYAKLNE